MQLQQSFSACWKLLHDVECRNTRYNFIHDFRISAVFQVTGTYMALQMIILGKIHESFSIDRVSEWQLYWVCSSQAGYQRVPVLQGMDQWEASIVRAWPMRGAELWTGYTSGDWGRDELMSGCPHLIGQKRSTPPSDWLFMFNRLARSFDWGPFI